MHCRELYQVFTRLGIFVAAFLLTSVVQGQVTAPPQQDGGNRINIDSTDVFHFATFGKDSIRIRKLLGNVCLSQDSTTLYCDSAYQFIDSNYVEAFSNVRIVMNTHMPDSMRRTIKSDRLTFNGNTKIIDFWDHVVLRDKDITLTTPRLTYYRIEDYAEYLQGGVIVNDSNTLTSNKGYYYPKDDMAYFKDEVVLVNPDFVLTTDTLGYNTETKVAFFMAPTVVKDSVNDMYTEDGYYDTENDFVLLTQNASIGDTSYTLFGDTIQYDQLKDLGKAMGHVKVVQKDTSMTIFGKYAEFQSKTEASFVTDSAFAIQRMDDDTLYLFADTLTSYKDTVTDKRYFEAYNDAYFFMNELQGVCDSLVYWYDDSLMFFYKRPALWSDASQITGDTIIIQLKGGGIDSMSIPSSPFIITQEDTVGYDQIKGKELHAKFNLKKLQTMWIFGNSESIYYTKDDKEQYIGMNKARCTDMTVDFKDNKPSKILFRENPEGEFFPMHMVLYKENLLDGFEWREKDRPIYPEWVLEHIAKSEGRVDTIRLRLDSLMMTLEDVEFAIYDLRQDSILGKFLKILESMGTEPEGTGAIDSLDTLRIDGPDSLPKMGKDSLQVGNPDSLAANDPTFNPKDSIKLVEQPEIVYAPGEHQTWEMASQARDSKGRLIQQKTSKQRKESSKRAISEGEGDKTPTEPSEKPKRTAKERISKLKEDVKAAKQKIKASTSKEAAAAREQKKLDRYKNKILKKAERDAKKHLRKVKRQKRRSKPSESGSEAKKSMFA